MKFHCLRLKSHPQSVAKIEPFVKELTAVLRIRQEKFPDILISLTEAVNNAITHGNKNDQNKFVNIKVHENNNRLCVSVKDEGCGFNPEVIPDPTAPENLECCGGRGVFLIKELSDKVHYSDNGCTVEMHFQL